MKKTLILLSILTSFVAYAQSIEISPNGGNTNSSAILDLKSTTKGFLLPRMTNAQMRAIPNPAQGLLAFCTDCSTNGDYYFYKGTAWVALGSTTVSVSTTMGSVSVNADEKGATITNGVLNLAPANGDNPGIVTKAAQTFGGVKTFTSVIVGNVTGNATTVTTNANLTGVVTSTGNTTSIANGAITNAMLANGAVANLSGTNTGDQTNITGNAATVTTNANLTGDVTSNGNATTVVKINGTSLSGLATGILKNTTSTGVPTIAAAGTDYQRPITLTTTGSGAATLSSNTLNIPNVSYTLPTATSSTLGGVKPDGTTILNNDGVISVASVAGSGVPYTGATSAVNLGAYDLTVNGLKIGKGAGGISSNTAVGASALSSNTTGEANTANGNSALSSNTTGFGNTANGKDALFSNTTGINNTANGVEALYHNTTGTENTANGASALFSNTTGFHNTANGSNALLSNTEGSSNTANGVFALISNINGSHNTAIGSSALAENTSGSNNTATGSGTLFSNTTGEANTANGMNALSLNLSGSNNTAFGQEALYANTLGNDNTAFGNFALKTNTTGTFNTAIGTSAGVSTGNLSNTTAIGYGATVNANNKIQLGNGEVTAVQLGTGSKVTLETGFLKITGGTPGAGKVLNSDADGLASWATPSGGVDLTTAQTIAGVKTFSVAPVLSSTTASKALFTDANKNIVSNEITGTGNVVMSNAPTFTGTVSGIDKSMVGLANVDNTTDANKPVSTAAQTALNLKADKANPTFTGTVNGIDKTMVGLSNIDNTSDANKPVSTAAQTALNLKADKANPTFTGTVNGIDKTMVGLSNLDNTSDANKPVSTATQTALNFKADKANPTFTGIITAASQNLSGTLGVGTSSPDASAKLDITSTTQGFLPPRMTRSQRDLISPKVAGLMIYCSDCVTNGELQFYNGGSAWVSMSGGNSVPTAPTIGTASRGINQATVAFTPPENNGGSAITSYTVFTNPEGLNKSGTSSPIIVTGLSTNTTYNFRVTATNTSGTSLFSGYSNSPYAPADAPTNVVATKGEDSKSTISFNTPSGNGSTITGYTINSNPEGIVVTGTSSPIVVTGLTNGTHYTFTVKAINSYGPGLAGTSNSVMPYTFQYLCGASSVTFTYNGTSVTYGVVVSGNYKCWLDRNLGATQVATSLQDAASYGDLFQAGRGADGHQLKTSGITSTLSTSDIPGNSNFIRTDNAANNNDWRNPQNANLWQGVNGVNNPCPSGFRLPSFSELVSEYSSWNSATYSGAFASPLKLPLAGFRNGFNGELYSIGSRGEYWTSDFTRNEAASLSMRTTETSVGVTPSNRSQGFSVRCIKD